MKTALVYVHIGNDIPNYLYDNIYQTLLINNYGTTLYICLNDNLVNEFNLTLDKFNLNVYTKNIFYYKNVIQVIPLSLLENFLKDNEHFTRYKNKISNDYSDKGQFRGGFWISTTSRFFYIFALMKIFQIKNVFHIENDVMLYEDINTLYNFLLNYFKSEDIDKVCMVQDAPGRVIPSIMFFGNDKILERLNIFISDIFEKSPYFMNDMDILGRYMDKYELPVEPNEHLMVFDGAAIGQYLGGVDPKNISNEKNMLIEYMNPTRGFVNETALLKPNVLQFRKTNVCMDHLDISTNMYLVSNDNKKYNTIANLHIHSKQLYQFSSVLDIGIEDIISGDRVLSLCDFVFVTRDILDFHKNIEKYARDVIIINDFNNINVESLNNYFMEHCTKNNTDTIKIFVYTHILSYLIETLTEKINKNIKIVLYTHNSDHHFNNEYKNLVECDNIVHIYAQNIDYGSYNSKITLLPIGLANAMWPHGDMIALYTVMKDTYRNIKERDIYVNINPNTYMYRGEILNKIKETKCYDLSSGKPYIEYLRELSEHRFCLCIRGNGLDTHRFWESLYLGVIPVIINNNTTSCDNFVRYLRDLDIPFVEIKNDNLDILGLKYNKNYFSENLYKNMIKKSGGIYNLKGLKMAGYTYIF